MGALNLFGLLMSGLGKLGAKGAADVARFFRGTWSVTVGNAIQGIFGTTIQSYYGPYITHVMDSEALGIAGFFGKYMNDPISNSPWKSLLFGIDGYVTWIYGANITCNYGGPVAVIQRATALSKTGQVFKYASSDPKDLTSQKTAKPLSWSLKDYTAEGDKPKSDDIEATAAADGATLKAINILSIVLNLTVAILELTVKFGYSSYDPKKDANRLQSYDPSADDSNLSSDSPVPDIIDVVIALLVPRLMNIIYGIEKAGWNESFAATCLKQAGDFFKDVASAIAYPFSYAGAKLGEGAQSTQDAIKTLEQMIGILTPMAM
jgi:hypothetical protein